MCINRVETLSHYFSFLLLSLIHVCFVWIPNMPSAFAICFVEPVDLIISSRSPFAVSAFVVLLSM